MVVLKKPERLDEIQWLNEEAFPPEERLEVARLARLAATEAFDLLAAWDEAQFVGFAFLAVSGSNTYLLLLAVEASLRSCGYGGAILRALRARYPDCRIAVDIQRVDVPSDNPEQRRKRRAFYVNNGFCATGWHMVFQGLEFEVLCAGADFDARGMEQIMQILSEHGFAMQIKPAQA